MHMILIYHMSGLGVGDVTRVMFFKKKKKKKSRILYVH